MKKILLAIAIVPSLLWAQDEEPLGWTREGKVSFQVNQVTLHNWNAGGQNSVSAVGRFSYNFGYKTETANWDNSLKLAYGLQKLGKDELQKIDDQIDFLSQVNRDLKGKWKYSGLLNFKTQFTEGYNYPNDSVPISNALAPAYLIASAGFEYKPNKHFRLMLSPLTGKLTMVLDTALSNDGAFGLDTGATTRIELGAFLKASFKKDIMENVNLETKLDLFSNYLENPQNIDVNWETYINMKVNSFLTVSVMTHLIYDHDIMIAYDDSDPSLEGPRTQFKEVLGVGVTYKF